MYHFFCSMFGAVYISFIIIGQLCITAIIPVTMSIRDMYYRHEAAGMLSSRSVMLGLLAAEIPFIAIMTILFPILFLDGLGMPNEGALLAVARGFAFWLFFGLNTAIYSYIGECILAIAFVQHYSDKLTINLHYCHLSGQMFCFLVPSQETAVVLANVFIGLNNLYSGFVASPATMTRKIFFKILYCVAPGHYVFEGLVLSLFHRDETRSVTVSETSPYFSELGCVADGSGSCTVPVTEFLNVYFDGMWEGRTVWRVNLVVLVLWSVCVRIIGSIALRYLKYSGK
jgi:ABC-type multidrug transport system permease subunit